MKKIINVLTVLGCLLLTGNAFSQNIDVQVAVMNGLNNCTNAIGATGIPQCQINKCHDRVKITVVVQNNTSWGRVIEQWLPNSAVIIPNTANVIVNGSVGVIDCQSISGFCFAQNNGVVTFTLPQQPVVASCTLTYEIFFDCNNATAQNGAKLKTECPGATFGNPVNNIVNSIEYTLDLISPEIKIQNYPVTYNLLLGDDTRTGQPQQSIVRTFDICATAGKIDAFNFNYTPEPEVDNVKLVFTGNTSTPFSVTNFSSTIAFTPTVVQGLVSTGYIAGTTCIHAREEYRVIACSPSPNTASTCTASTVCNSLLGPITCSNASVSSNTVVAETGADDLIATFYFRDNNNLPIVGGLSPCDAVNGNFRFDYGIYNNATQAGSAANSNFKSLQTFEARIPLGGAGQPGWFLISPPPSVYVGNTLLAPNQFAISSTGIVINFNTLTTPIPPLTSLSNNDIIPNELPGGPSAFTVSIRGLKLNTANSLLDNCDASIQQYILGASPTAATGRSKITYYTMCDNSNLRTKYFSANYSNTGNSVIYGSPIPADAKQGVNNKLNFCWENTGSATGNPWEFKNGTDVLITCPVNDLKYQVKLTLPQSLNFAATPNLSFLAFPGTAIGLTVPTPTVLGNGSKVYIISGVSRNGCLSGDVTLNYSNTNVCNASTGLLFGTADATAEMRAICDATGPCEVPFCIGKVTNHLFYHCPGSCTGALTGVASMNTTHPITFRRIDDVSDNVSGGTPDLQRSYVCDDIEVEVQGYKLAGTPNTIFLKLNYEAVAGTSNSIFTPQNVTNANQYSLDGGTTWTNISFSGITGPTLVSGIWEIKASITAGNLGSVNTTANGLRFKLRLKVRNDLTNTLNNGVYNLQDVRADIGYLNGGNYYGACDTWAEHMLVLAHEYNQQINFVLGNDDFYGESGLGVCKQRMRIRNYISGGLPQSDEMPSEIRPLVLWPNNLGLNTLGITTDLTDMTLTKIQFSSNTTSSLIPLNNPSQVSITGNSIKIYGIGATNSWPVIDKNGISTIDMTMLLDFTKKTCEGVFPSTQLHFPIWTRNNTGCSPSTTPNSPQDYQVVTQGATASKVSLAINGSAAPAITLNAASNPVIVPVTITYTGIPNQVENGWIFPVSSTATPAPTLEIATSITGPFTALPYGAYFGTGILSQSVAKSYFLRITYTNCSPQDIVFKSGYSCSPINTLTVPPNNSLDCKTNATTLTLKPGTPSLQLGLTSSPTVNGANNCSVYPMGLFIKANAAACYNPDIIITTPLGLRLVSCTLTYNGNSAIVNTVTPPTTSLASALQTLLIANGNGGPNSWALPVGQTVSIVANFTGITTNCVVGSVSPDFIGTWRDLCGTQQSTASSAGGVQSATFIFVPDAQACSVCVPCFTYQPAVNYAASSSGCNNQQGTITMQLTIPTLWPNGVMISSMVYHYTGIGNALSGSGSAGIGNTLIGSLAEGDYDVYLSFDIIVSGVVTHCSTPIVPIHITKTNCCQGDIISGTATKTIDGTVNPKYTSSLSAAEISWLNSVGNVSINGTFVVNTLGFNIKNCRVLFGENATIRIINQPVPNTNSLIIENSILETCNDWMWQGIVLDGSRSALNLSSATIRDAFWAVRADAGGVFTALNSKFENNQVGVAIANTGPAFFAPIKGCTFSNPVNNLKTPFTGNRSLVGIQAQNAEGWQIGSDIDDPIYTNKFIGINCGIHSMNSTITVYNNYFKDIKNYYPIPPFGTPAPAVPNYPFRGWAVWALSGFGETEVGSLTVRTTNVMPHAGTPQNTNFLECDGAIYAANTALSAYLNNIVQCRDGVQVSYATSRDALVAFNGFYDCVYGVTYSDNVNAYQLTVENYIKNSQQYNGYPNFLTNSNCYGIYVAETSGNTNQIIDNVLYNGRTGIKLTQTGINTLVQGNRIAITDNVTTARRIGIAIENANGSFIEDNIILGNGPNWQGGINSNISSYSANRIGINANASPNLTITCNNIGFDPLNNGTPGIGRALNFSQNCNTAYNAIRENYMSNTYVPLFLERIGPNNGSIGQNAGSINYVNRNSFGSAANSLGARTYNYCSTISPIYVTSFWYRSTDTWKNDINEASTSNNLHKMQLSTAVASATASVNCENPNYNGLVAGGGGSNTNLWTDVSKALDMTNYPNYEDFLKANDKRDLFTRLATNEAYRNSLTTLDNFYNDYLASEGKKLYDFSKKMEDLRQDENSWLTLMRHIAKSELQAKGAVIRGLSQQLETAIALGDTAQVANIQFTLQQQASNLERDMVKARNLGKYRTDTLKLEKALQAEQELKEYFALNEKLQNTAAYPDSAAYVADIQAAERKKVDYTQSKASSKTTTADSVAASTLQKLIEGEATLMNVYSEKNYEQNEKKLGQLIVKFNKMGPTTILPSEWDWVSALANSCPLKEGYAVYTARAFYSHIDHSVYYDDASLCEQVGFYKTDEEESDLHKITSETATLWYDTKGNTAFVNYEFIPDAGGWVSIYNILGQPMASAILEPNNKLALVGLPDIASGEYYYQVKSDKGYTATGKFIVIH